MASKQTAICKPQTIRGIFQVICNTCFYGPTRKWGKVCFCACAPCQNGNGKLPRSRQFLVFVYCQMEQHTAVTSSDSLLSSARHDIRWCLDWDQRPKTPTKQGGQRFLAPAALSIKNISVRWTWGTKIYIVVLTNCIYSYYRQANK